MSARAHYIPRNESSAQPSRFIFAAVESDARPMAGGLTNNVVKAWAAHVWLRARSRQPEREAVVCGTTIDEWAALLELNMAKGRRVVVVFHKAGYALQCLGGPAELSRRGWTVTRAVVDTHRTILRATFGGGSITVLDMANYLSSSLDELGDLVDIASWPELPARANDGAARARAAHSARIVAVAFRRYLTLCRDNDLGHFATTLARQSSNAFRHRFMTHQILVHPFEAVSALERSAYYGARNECYRLGQLTSGPYTKLDINSAFAAVMRTENYPTAYESTAQSPTLVSVERALSTRCAVARALVETDEPVYPLHHEGRLIFPVGRFWTTLCTPELAHAIARKRIIAYETVAWYKRAPIFTRFVDGIYPLRIAARADGQRFEAAIWKQVLVSLYGRFGMRLKRWEKVGQEPGLPDERTLEYSVDTGTTTEYRRIGGLVETSSKDEDAPETFTAIAAHVASSARILLWRYMTKAGRDHVVYCDTDGLIVDPAGARALAPWVDPNKLGYLKLEECADAIEIGGTKMYRMGGRLVQRGRRSSAVSLGGWDYRQTQSTGLMAAASMGHIGGAVTQIVERHLSGEYRAGTVDDLGRVSPLRLS